METVECSLPEGVKLIAPKDDHIGRQYEKGSWYEDTMLRYMQRLGPDLTYLDAGAFVGGHSLYMARLCKAKKVYAFEPNPELFALLKENIRLNGLENIITAYNVALGLSEGQGVMRPRFDGNRGAWAVQPRHEGDIRILTLDSFTLPKIDVVKIDVEGMADFVLAGGKMFLSVHKPRLFIECADKEELEAVEIELQPFGYKRGDCFNWTPTHEFIPEV